MEAPVPVPVVKVKFELGSETFFAEAKYDTGGLISHHLVSIKQSSITILNDFITKHNFPNDDLPEDEDEDEDEDEEADADADATASPPVKKKSKKQK